MILVSSCHARPCMPAGVVAASTSGLRARRRAVESRLLSRRDGEGDLASSGGRHTALDQERRESGLLASTAAASAARGARGHSGGGAGNSARGRRVAAVVRVPGGAGEGASSRVARGERATGSNREGGRGEGGGGGEAGGAAGGGEGHGVNGGGAADSGDLTLYGATCMSFLWSMGSFMVLSLLPVYLRENLGLSNSKIGALEGFAVVASSLAKGFSGVVSDLMGSRKLILLLGSTVTLVIKPLFALSPYVHSLLSLPPLSLSVSLFSL